MRKISGVIELYWLLNSMKNINGQISKRYYVLDSHLRLGYLGDTVFSIALKKKNPFKTIKSEIDKVLWILIQ